ncbi:ARPP-1 family domain-containing protein [Candidatus Palauibacter sp.]|uniref:ARPP-1 family domain-containing protein n=1 Tax=Candidatus Palauibacter sp. TaxID=3101350 RepID=UPI003AF23C47
MDQVRTAISSLGIGEPTFHGGLTVFPLTAEDRPSLSYLMLAEGLEKGLVSVTEVSEGGSVPDLAVENRADRPLLIVDGEELVGAKQNRVANLTLLAAAGKTTIIPVSCVEAGRWSYDRPDFEVSERMHYASGRAERYRSVQESMRTTGTRHSDQGRVWSSIDETADAMAAPSETGAMSAIFDRHEKTLDDYVRGVAPAPEQVGAIFAVGERRYGLDVFDRPGTLAAFLPRLVRSYAVDALARRAEAVKAAPLSGARGFLDRLREGSFDDYPAVGLGRDVGIVADGAIGGALVADDVTVHLTGFSDPRDDRGGRDERPDHANYRQRRDSLRRRHGRPESAETGP